MTVHPKEAIPAIPRERGHEAIQRLINSHFGNPNPARCHIPADRANDDDLVAFDYVLQLEQRIAQAEHALKEMTEDRNLWREAHDEDCPNLAALKQVESVPSGLGPLWEELQAVARTGGATVAAETCMGLIKEVVKLRAQRDALLKPATDAEWNIFSKTLILPSFARSGNREKVSVIGRQQLDKLLAARAALAAEPGEERKQDGAA